MYDFGSGAALVVDVQPGGAGLGKLLETLGSLHRQSSRLLVCLDMSGSFEGQRADAFARACEILREDPSTVLDTFVCFSGNAVRQTGLRAKLIDENIEVPTCTVELQDGTNWEALRTCILDVQRETSVGRVLLVSDGEFSDDGVLDRLRVELNADVELVD